MTAEFTTFAVKVTPLTRGYNVDIDAGEGVCAAVYAPDVETALRMAVPYMAIVVEPDPLERLFRGPAAPGSPPDMGGADAS